MILVGLRALLKSFAQFRPPEPSDAEVPDGSPSPPGEEGPIPVPPALAPLPSPPSRGGALGVALLGTVALLVCDQTLVGAWIAVGLGVVLWAVRRRRSAASVEESLLDKRTRIAAIRASGRLDVIWFYALPLVLPSLILLVRARTWQGSAFSLLCVLAPVSLVLFAGGRRLAAKLALAVIVALGLALWAVVPRADPGAIESRLLSGPAPASWTPAALVPEEDQFQLGTFFLSLGDPLVDWEQSVRVRRVFGEVYDRAGRDPDLAGLPGIMSATYRDVVAAELPHHLYVYAPSSAAPRPVVLFLHGSLGSFQGYLSALKALADQEELAIVSVSFGAGLWDRPGGVERIEEALELCAQDPRLDSERVVLVGISAGGRATSLAGAAFPSRLAGLAFLSPAIAPELFKDLWRGRPVLVVHGALDRRIPASLVEGAVSELKQAGVETTYLLVPGEDHFLYFSDTATVNAALSEWIRGVLRSGGESGTGGRGGLDPDRRSRVR
ncbi:MAG: prolyl oligopeptidase family serine peptidase [Planctomycetes bacterium]|nr:prolyl oligopeptidase family serine peptidase [Planctomycetota bacterium]